ncbi:hypothetical protein GCM10028784_26090 [Myceligenerans cantabricum]
MALAAPEEAAVVLSGYGPVGQVLLGHLPSHGESLAKRHGVLVRVAAVRTSTHAVRLGIAEADPTSDLSGDDAATKARLLAALLWGWDPAAVRVCTEPVDSGTARAARGAATRGRRLRAVASVRRERPHRVHVRLEETAPGDPLYAPTGPEKAVMLGCPEAGEVVGGGGRSSSLGAALALIKDTIELTVPRAGFN